jgi:hypothetical protein
LKFLFKKEKKKKCAIFYFLNSKTGALSYQQKSEKFSEKVLKFETYHFCRECQKKYQADVLAWLAH